jgi:hypothetical protein
MTNYEQREVATALGALPKLAPPQELAAKLRVTASRERRRRRIHATWDSLWAHYRDRAHLWFENCMRPVAVPAAGGVMSALVLFAVLVANYPMRASNSLIPDTPVGEYQEASFLNMGPILLDTQEVVVDLVIDQQGRVVDYKIADGGIPVQNQAQLRRQIESALLYATFEPATRFGQPVGGGRVRLSFRHGYIEVRG